MGFNTVAFFLNDMMHILEKSPKTLAWALTHPPMGGELDLRSWKAQVRLAAEHEKEPMLPPQALEVLPTFHADIRKWIVAGNNGIQELKFVRYSKNKRGKKLAVLELPNDWQGHSGWSQCRHTWIDNQRRGVQCSLLADHDGPHECEHNMAHENCGSHKPLEVIV
jgi:hypothetical protein